MKRETIAIHSGYDIDPTTKAVAVPIYQTVAYAFDSTEHAAALFNLEVDGYRYTRISNPTTAVLERRVAALEGGRDAMCVASGQAAVTYAVQNVTELGCNIISTPQLYGTTQVMLQAGSKDGAAAPGGVDVKPQPLLAAELSHSRQRIDYSRRRGPGGTDNHEREEAIVSILRHTSL